MWQVMWKITPCEQGCFGSGKRPSFCLLWKDEEPIYTKKHKGPKFNCTNNWETKNMTSLYKNYHLRHLDLAYLLSHNWAMVKHVSNYKDPIWVIMNTCTIVLDSWWIMNLLIEFKPKKSYIMLGWPCKIGFGRPIGWGDGGGLIVALPAMQANQRNQRPPICSLLLHLKDLGAS
jgi:hypothetical protein